MMHDMWIVRVWYRPSFAQFAGCFDVSFNRAREKHSNPVPMLAYCLGQRKSIEGARHFDVCEHDIDIVFVQDRQSFFCVRGFDHLIAAVAQVLRNWRAY